MSDIPAPAARPKFSPTTRIIIIIVSIAVMAGGILQMVRGLRGTKMDPEVERLSKESDSAFADANTDLAAAAPLFQSVLEAVDKEGLGTVRAQKKAEVEKVAGLFERASQKLRLAAQKGSDAAALKPGEKLQAFLETKAEAYRGFASARDVSRDIARMILDDSIKTSEELIPKMTEAATRCQKLEASANEVNARADKVVADSKQ